RSPLPMQEAELSAALTGLQGSWRRDGDGVELRFPWKVGQAVPVVSRFCLGQPGDGGWRLWLPASD
ncbi:MAG: hypothetical protein LUF68_03520, partial [Clostridiales bacterium]|nr:hypothetical protein [Clostridiales bacterium]